MKLGKERFPLGVLSNSDHPSHKIYENDTKTPPTPQKKPQQSKEKETAQEYSRELV